MIKPANVLKNKKDEQNNTSGKDKEQSNKKG